MTEVTWAERSELADDIATRLIRAVARHWLFLVNTLVGVFAGLPFLAPIFMAVGWTTPARLIYFMYRFTCHQLPYRSFFLGGPKATYTQAEIAMLTGKASLVDLLHHPITAAGVGFQVAYCQRDVAIYTTIFLAGLAFTLVRRWLKPLPFKFFLLFCVPIAVDGFTQLFGWRDRNAFRTGCCLAGLSLC